MLLNMKPFLILYFLIMLHTLSAQRDTLIYIGDPMCSWCYGFGPELDKIKNAFPETAFEMVMGGLRAGGTETMMELKNFLKEHWMEVNHTTGQRFNYAILEQSSVLYDTEPSCRAVLVAGEMAPSKKYDYFKSVQESFYFHNSLPNDDETYILLAQKAGIDPKAFAIKYRALQSKEKVYSEFELAQKMGVTGFPSLIAKIDGKLFLVTNGYQKADGIITSLKNRGLK
jgi:putative protein-disulfide isomerase